MRTKSEINIKEKKKQYMIEMETPGLKKKDFNIYTEGNSLIISCKKEEKRANYWSLLRFISLPEDADSDRVTAKYNGTLILRIPKKAAARKNTHSQTN